MDYYEKENHNEIIQDVENTAIDMGTYIDIGIALGKLDDVIQNVKGSRENHKENEVLDYLDDVIQNVEKTSYNNDSKPKLQEEILKYEIL